MATLQQIALGTLTGVAPVPVAQVAINNYLVHDDLLNLMEFLNVGMGSNQGNIKAEYKYYDGEAAEAVFRRIGKEYVADNAVPKTGTVTLKPLGGSYEVDSIQRRAFSNNPKAVSNWEGQQIEQNLNKIKNGYAKYFLQGDSKTDELQFDGLGDFFKRFPAQVNNTVFDLSGGLTDANALKLERHLNNSINKVKPGKANVIITNAIGKEILQSLNSFRHRGVSVIKVNDKEYDCYVGIPIVSLPDSYFEATDIADDKVPVIFGHISKVLNEGICTVIPVDGELLAYEPANKNGVFVGTGGVEMLCSPVFASAFCASKCYITEASAV